MSPVDSGKVIVEGAMFAITGAACVIPDAWFLAGECFKAQGDPGAIWDAGQAWFDHAEQIGQAIDAANRINAGIGATWSGADYDAFHEKSVDYLRQLIAAQMLSYTTGAALFTAAVETFAICLMWGVIGVALAIWAAAILTAMATGVGFLGPVEALEADALLFVVQCESVVRSADAATKGIDAVLAGGIGTLLGGNVIFQLATGNTKVLAELGVATVSGLGTIAAGMTAKVLQDKFVNKAYNPIGRTNLTTLLTGLGVGTSATDMNPVDKLSDWFDPSR